MWKLIIAVVALSDAGAPSVSTTTTTIWSGQRAVQQRLGNGRSMGSLL
jgi:hypothetical protein